MENAARSMRVFVVAMAVFFMVCAAAAPALAQANAQGGNVAVQLQYCPQVVQQYAGANQSNTGGGVAAAIAQNLGITQNAVNTCLQNVGATQDTDPPPATEDTNGEITEETIANVQGQNIVMSANLPKTLANTGGDETLVSGSASSATKVAMLIPAGALLVAAGATMIYAGNRRL